MATTIKTEAADPLASPPASAPIEPLELEEKIFELCAAYADGVSDAELQRKIPSTIDAKQRAAAINRLLAKSKLDLLKSGAMLIYRAKNADAADSNKIAGATNEETLVYRTIEESKNKGIWIRDIKRNTNLPETMLNKVLKTLESRKLVKSVKSVGASRKKVYMLYELEPDSDVTGGVFYSEQEFDSQFVDLLNQQCLKYLRAKAQTAQEKFPNDFLAKRKYGLTSSAEIWQHIKDLKISRIELSLADVEKVLDTVVFDGMADKELGAGSKAGNHPLYLARSTTPSGSHNSFAGLVKTPCAFCPLVADCRPKGLISPATCVYFKEWLID